jgi:hypothetical protein
MRFCLSVLIAASLILLAACGDDDEPSVTDTPTASPTSTKPTNPPTRTLSPPQPPRQLAGIDFYTWDSWIAKGLGGCPSQNPEAPFLGASVFSVSQDDLSDIPLLAGHDIGNIRMCKLGGITVLLDPELEVVLVAGPPQWPALVPLEELRVVTTAVGDVVVAPPREDFPMGGATAVRIAPFGLVVSYGRPEEEAVSAVASIDVDGLDIPLGKDIFTGDINGIHFESEFSDRSKECTYSAYGFSGEPTTAPSDPRIVIEPGYLPANAIAHQTVLYRHCDDVESADVTYYISGSTPDNQYWIVRLSKADWGSVYAEDWYTETTVAELDAVLRSAPPGIETDAGAALFVREAFGLTAITGPDAVELVKIAEKLNR